MYIESDLSRTYLTQRVHLLWSAFYCLRSQRGVWRRLKWDTKRSGPRGSDFHNRVKEHGPPKAFYPPMDRPS